jgi:hypothetical protein
VTHCPTAHPNTPVSATSVIIAFGIPTQGTLRNSEQYKFRLCLAQIAEVSCSKHLRMRLLFVIYIYFLYSGESQKGSAPLVPGFVRSVDECLVRRAKLRLRRGHCGCNQGSGGTLQLACPQAHLEATIRRSSESGHLWFRACRSTLDHVYFPNFSHD